MKRQRGAIEWGYVVENVIVWTCGVAAGGVIVVRVLEWLT